MKIPMALWPRLMPLLDQVLALPEGERGAWLASQQLDADTTAALRQLLADRQALDGGDFMAALPPLLPDGDDTRPGGASQLGLFAGDLIGPYRLIRPLGQGGMSVVWLAERDDGQARRQVALKMPHAGPGQALLAERLRRERDILASLEHRHIARLYDVGSTEQGLPYLVLEYIEGQSLPEHCDAHQLGIPARLRLFLQVLEAVQCAHSRLVLHRDLKPGNILVNAQGEVKLLDFGIAKLIRDSATGTAASTELTQHSGHVLTPDYAAPEQIAGRPLSTASDVYALGVILFELLTGQRPYRLPRGTRGALEEAILATDPRRPSQVWQDADVQTHHVDHSTLDELAVHYRSSPRRLSQQLRGDLDLIVATALQKHSARRYPTAEAFAHDIQRHLASQPIAAQPDSRWYRLRKYTQRHAWALTAVGAVVAALSVGLGLALWQAEQARREAAKATAIKDFLIGLFENGDVEQPDAQRKRHETVEQLLASSARALRTELQDQPRVRAELQGVVGGLLHNLAITDEAMALRRERVRQLDALGASVAERAQAWRDLADSQDARGDTSGAQASLDAGLALCRAAGMAPVEVCHGLQVAKGWQLVVAGRTAEAAALVGPAIEALRRRAPHSIQMADALVTQGDLLSHKSEFDQSYALYKDSIALRARLWGPHSVRLARERYQLAMGLSSQRRLAQAIEQFQLAWQAMSAALGPDHANSLIIELQLGRLQALLSPAPQGLGHVRRAAALLLARADQLDPRTHFNAEHALAEVLLSNGQLDEAEPHLHRALALSRSLRGRIPDDGAPEANLAWSLQSRGRYDEAGALLEATRSRLAQVWGQHDRRVADLLDRLADTRFLQGQLDLAWQLFSSGLQSADFKEEQYGSHKHSLSAGHAAVWMARGQFDQAAAIVEPLHQAMQRTPPAEMYWGSVYASNDRMARLRAGQGRHREALPYFEAAIGAMAGGFAHNPDLAVTRARYGLSLLQLGRLPLAAEQLRLAERAVAAHTQLAPHLLAPVARLRAEWLAATQARSG